MRVHLHMGGPTRIDMRRRIFFLVILTLWFTPTVQADPEAESTKRIGYAVGEVRHEHIVEHQFYLNEHHFLTVLDNAGAFTVRPHPGVDLNGWGSSVYLQPFLPGATLKHTKIDSIAAVKDGIESRTSGRVSRGAADTYGTWRMQVVFHYDPCAKRIVGKGSYQIQLDGRLSSSTGDLNLLRIASNYLHEVPLLGGGTGDTGDMKVALVSGGAWNLRWDPVKFPSCFPRHTADALSIEVVGAYNNVDTAAQGYAPIAAAYKPTLKIGLTSHHSGIPMIFGAIYAQSKRGDFWEDNVGITPLVLEDSSFVAYRFDLTFEATALEGDGGTGIVQPWKSSTASVPTQGSGPRPQPIDGNPHELSNP